MLQCRGCGGTQSAQRGCRAGAQVTSHRRAGKVRWSGHCSRVVWAVRVAGSWVEWSSCVEWSRYIEYIAKPPALYPASSPAPSPELYPASSLPPVPLSGDVEEGPSAVLRVRCVHIASDAAAYAARRRRCDHELPVSRAVNVL